jgi:23S rRNA (uracil1939-C5)-methyltransferase/tRNA (uracil-5-)-methyltransferase
LDVENCVIATRPINNKLVLLRKELQEKALSGKLKRPSRGATLLLRHHEEDEVTTDPNQLVSTTVNNLKFSFLAGSFFQNNPFVLPLMVQHVVDGAAFSKSGRRMTHLIDCYCGSGLFCISASHLFETCVGIEVNEKAIEEARCNGKLNNIENCSFIAASAEAIFESNDLIPWRNCDEKGETKLLCVRDFPRETTVVVLDPPRKGCSPEFLEQLYKFEPQRVVYMSCDPSTQARDANGLVSNGYEIVSVQPFDLFPQTRHVECLIIFERR